MVVINGVPLNGIIVDVILFFIIAGNAVIGYRKGLARLICSLLSSIIAIILVFILYRPVTNYVIYNTKASEKLESIFEENLQFLFEDENEATEDNNAMMSILKVFIGDEMGNLIEETTDNVVDYLSIELSHKIISIFIFFALFAIIRLFLYVLRNYIEMVVNLPIVRVFNGSGGMIYGIIRGFFIIYVAFAFLTLLLSIIGNNVIITAIQNAPIGHKMFNNNILLNAICKFL